MRIRSFAFVAFLGVTGFALADGSMPNNPPMSSPATTSRTSGSSSANMSQDHSLRKDRGDLRRDRQDMRNDRERMRRDRQDMREDREQYRQERREQRENRRHQGGGAIQPNNSAGAAG